MAMFYGHLQQVPQKAYRVPTLQWLRAAREAVMDGRQMTQLIKPSRDVNINAR